MPVGDVPYGPPPPPMLGAGPMFGGPGMGGPLVPVGVVQQPATALVSRPVAVPRGHCPSNQPALRPCDAKRPWPQCPPSSYCYAVNTVDIGPYFCCPVCEHNLHHIYLYSYV